MKFKIREQTCLELSLQQTIGLRSHAAFWFFFFLEESAERRGMGRDAELSRAAAAAAALALPNLHLNNKHI